MVSLPSDLQTLCCDWYILDTNTNAYILRDLIDKDDPVFWATQPKILKALTDVPFDEHICPGLLVGCSVTECEVQYILSNPQLLKRARWFKRDLRGAIPDIPKSASQKEKGNALSDGSWDSDASSRLMVLTQRMIDGFMGCGVPDALRTYEVSVDAYVAEGNNPEKEEYLKQWKQDMLSMLNAEVMELIDVKRRWSIDGCGLGISGEDVDEMLHHYSWAREKCSDFEGREDLIQSALECIQTENRPKNRGKSINFAQISFACNYAH